MKKVLAFMVLLPLALCAQVRVAKPAERAEKAVVPYDSTQVVCEMRIELLRGYIGQEFFVIPKTERLQTIGYNMTRDKNGSFYDRIPYEELAGKTLRVADATYGGRSKYDPSVLWRFLGPVFPRRCKRRCRPCPDTPGDTA